MNKSLFGNKVKISLLDITLMLLLVLGVILYISYFINLDVVPYEDAAILMRYAKHVAGGFGMVWNIGEKPVDGATDFLYVIVLGGIVRMGLPVEAASRMLGILSHIGCVLIVFYMNRKLFNIPSWLAFVCSVSLAFGPGLKYVEAGFGTTFFVFFILLGWYVTNLIISGKRTKNFLIIFSLIALLIGLIRPEGVFIGALFLLSLVVSGTRQDAKRYIVVYLIIFGILGSIYFLWRWNYFGYPLPNPFYRKGGWNIYPGSIDKSFGYVFSMSFPFILVLVLGGLVTIISTIGKLKTIHYRFLSIGFFVCGGLCLLRTSSSYVEDHAWLILGRYSMRYFLIILGLFVFSFVIWFVGIDSKKRFGVNLSEWVQEKIKKIPEKMRIELEKINQISLITLIPVIGFTTVWLLLSNEMNYLARFQYPAIGIVLASFPPILWAFWQFYLACRPEPRGNEKFNPWKNGLIAFGIVLVCLIICIYQLSRYVGETYEKGDGRYAVGKILYDYKDAGYVIAISEAGLIPLYSEWRTIDTWGLNDQWIAHNNIITEDYLDRFQPEIIMFKAHFSPGVPLPENPKNDPFLNMEFVLNHYAVERGYTLAAVYGSGLYNTHYYYVKPDFKDSVEIAHRIATIPSYGPGVHNLLGIQ